MKMFFQIGIAVFLYCSFDLYRLFPDNRLPLPWEHACIALIAGLKTKTRPGNHPWRFIQIHVIHGNLLLSFRAGRRQGMK